MKIEVLGTGCAKCEKLAENARAAVAQAGCSCEIVKVKDLAEIASRGVMMTPALVVDGVVVASGKVPTPDQIVEFLNQE